MFCLSVSERPFWGTYPIVLNRILKIRMSTSKLQLQNFNMFNTVAPANYIAYFSAWLLHISFLTVWFGFLFVVGLFCLLTSCTDNSNSSNLSDSFWTISPVSGFCHFGGCRISKFEHAFSHLFTVFSINTASWSALSSELCLNTDSVKPQSSWLCSLIQRAKFETADCKWSSSMKFPVSYDRLKLVYLLKILWFFLKGS